MDGYELLRTYTEALRFADNGYPRTSPEDVPNFAQVMGYMVGWVHGYQMGAPLCIPEQNPAIKLVRIVVTYLRAHPQMLHYHRSALIRSALQEAFPCP